jgi:hypothetical protein
MTMEYTVSVTDWTEKRGYRDSGRGWRVRCFCLPSDDFNALGHTVFERYYRSEIKARAEAVALAKQYGAPFPA